MKRINYSIDEEEVCGPSKSQRGRVGEGAQRYEDPTDLQLQHLENNWKNIELQELASKTYSYKEVKKETKEMKKQEKKEQLERENRLLSLQKKENKRAKSILIFMMLLKNSDRQTADRNLPLSPKLARTAKDMPSCLSHALSLRQFWTGGAGEFHFAFCHIRTQWELDQDPDCNPPPAPPPPTIRCHV
ncbi:unnamed protein product [Pleuronectes platessa]|uniref:Uncharacterized protein n=1 Tax=Pleuronectes platessa TaxID=8262 RepID=A0A9N7YMT0_PLEPL|nr:unnamed protein product [Pleuronectes platessa]